MEEHFHPTPLQTAIYTRLHRRFGHTPEWQTLTKSRHFERMAPHRAAHFIARLLGDLTGHAATVPCGCTGQTFAAEPQKHPVSAGAPVARVV